MTERYEAVVVGAGPAGLAAAVELARLRVQTLVLERGKAPGTKNATGGILYGQTNTEYNLDHLYPEFHEEAPLERTVHAYHFHCLAGEKARAFDLTKLHQHQHKWSYSVLRAKFDAWFGAKAHKELRSLDGGVLSNVRVTGPLVEDGRIVGVETSELEPIRADLVIAADGATSELVRKAGLRGWGSAHAWFQGAKIVVKTTKEHIERAFGVSGREGVAHLFAGDLWDGVRGGGFLYTNLDTLSIGTVFHLDALAAAGVEPHRLMDRLLDHPLVQGWVGPDAKEAEYSAKLIPDGKKQQLAAPFAGRLLAVGDAAGQLQAQGPIIKGMNLGITAGILAAQAYAECKKEGRLSRVGPTYAEKLRASYVPGSVRPPGYAFAAATSENGFVNGLLEGFVRSRFGRALLRSRFGQRRVHGMLNSPFWAGSAPDIRFSYATLPAVIAEEAGKPVAAPAKRFGHRTLDERIAALDFDTDVGRPHIRLTSSAPADSGLAVTTCPVSARDSGRGCYRLETVKAHGAQEKVVALDTQPCIECGTCGIVAATDWSHPSGGKGVQYKFG